MSHITNSVERELRFAVPSIHLNVNYLKSNPGIIKQLEIVCGIICLVTIVVSCRQYNDPWMGTIVAGFAGGKAETSFFLFVFTCLFCTTLLLLSNLTVVVTDSAILIKDNFSLIFNLVAFCVYILTSLILIIEISSRNERSVDKEPGYASKITAGAFGLINSVLYILSTFYSYKTCV